jgi:hypothetical protein
MSYLERAALVGHDEEALKAGQVVRSKVQVQSLDQFKKIFADGLSNDQRASYARDSHQKKSVGVNSSTSTTIDQLTIDRLMDHVFGVEPLSERDSQAAKSIFPVTITAISGATYSVTHDEIFDRSTGPCFINAGTLVFDNASITAKGVISKVIADTLQITARTAVPSLINILGVTGSNGAAGAAGQVLQQAANGADSSGGSPGVCTGASNGQSGSNGKTGNPGSAGYPGANGIASAVSVIQIDAYVGATTNQPFTVFAQSGAGGNGGQGGAGGQGQQGGNGGNGCANGCEGTDGGAGGNGGNGGDGGPGGNGGNGVNGANVSISFPNSAQVYLMASSIVASPGLGGIGGGRGPVGMGGNGGGSGKHHSDGSPGNIGTSVGSVGTAGVAGSATGAQISFSITYT